MKIRLIFQILILFNLIISSTALFATSSYAPPQQIQCTMTQGDNEYAMTCHGFDAQWLLYSGSTFDIPLNQPTTFTYAYADANYSPATGWQINYSYYSDNFNVAKLISMNNTIQPDFTNSAWQQIVSNNLYICGSANSNCAMINANN